MSQLKQSVVYSIIVTILLGLSGMMNAWGDQSMQKNSGMSEAVEGFVMSISLENDVVALGAPVKLEVTIDNVSQENLLLVQTGIDNDYSIVVKDKTGKLAVETKYWQQAKISTEEFKRTTSKLAPGAKITEVIDVSQRFLFDREGEYMITAQRNVLKRHSEGLAVLISNTVAVTIEAVTIEKSKPVSK